MGHHSGPGAIALEVPATYLSVNQQFSPLLVRTTEAAGRDATDITIKLLDSSGATLARDSAQLGDGAQAWAGTMSLPHAGHFRLEAVAGSDAAPLASLALEAIPEPSNSYGGVTALAGFGMPDGAAEYLRQHGFAMQPLDALKDGGEKLIVVGDARGSGSDLVQDYQELWRLVANGIGLVALEPVPPGISGYWPMIGPLERANGDCQADLQAPGLLNGLPGGTAAFLRPRLVNDLSNPATLDIYHLDGSWLLRRPREGYTGCHALYTFRYGAGWVTISHAPLLARFQDVRARLFLMNLIQAALRRKHRQPPSPGLAWVTAQRLNDLAKQPQSALATDAAVYHRNAPATAATPPALLVPLARTAQNAACWKSGAERAGASMLLDLRRAQPVRSLHLNFGNDPVQWPSFALSASVDGQQWVRLQNQAPDASGALSVAVPATAGGWRDFRLTLRAAQPTGWRMCEFSASLAQ